MMVTPITIRHPEAPAQSAGLMMTDRRRQFPDAIPTPEALTTRDLPPWDGHGSLDITRASGISRTSGGAMPGTGERLKRDGCASFAPALWLALLVSCSAMSAAG